MQQIDTGAFADDERQHRWLAAAGFERVRTWWQMKPAGDRRRGRSGALDPDSWERRGVRFRLVRRGGDGMPDDDDLREVHDVLEGAFRRPLQLWAETFDEFLHRLREDPGHRWDHWWLAELLDRGRTAEPSAPWSAPHSEGAPGPDASYVAYIGVLEAARGRGVAKGLLHTIIADAAARGRDRVGLEVDADSPPARTGSTSSMGWTTSYVTESWHRDVPVDDDPAWLNCDKGVSRRLTGETPARRGRRCRRSRSGSSPGTSSRVPRASRRAGTGRRAGGPGVAHDQDGVVAAAVLDQPAREPVGGRQGAVQERAGAEELADAGPSRRHQASSASGMCTK